MTGNLFEKLSTRTFARALFIVAAVVLLWGFVSNLFGWQYVPFFQVLLDDLYANVGSELLSIVLTVLVIEELNARRSRIEQEQRDRRAEEEDERRSKQIRDELRSYIQAQEIARLRAARTTEERQPILDSMKVTGLLKGANLRWSVLEKANLWEANLEAALLDNANLQGATLDGAQLTKADLSSANLDETNLSRAKLQGASLSQADLHMADLSYANLQGAWLLSAKLVEADLSHTNLKEANLSYASLQEADLRMANLEGATFEEADLMWAMGVNISQLRSAATLSSATLLDGKKLPRDNWRIAFEKWAETVVLDEDGNISTKWSGKY